MNQLPEKESGARDSRKMFTAVVVVLVLGLLSWALIAYMQGRSASSADPKVEPVASAAPTDNRADDEISEEARLVRESKGVENSYGVSEAPRDSEPDLEAEQLLASKPQESLEPKEMDVSVTVAHDVRIEIGEVQAVKAKAKLPGEISGPAVKVPVTITNNTDKVIISRDVIADVFFGEDLLPGTPLISAEDANFPISINPGDEVTASYVVVVPDGVGESIRVTVNYQAAEPVAVFDGIRPTAASE